MPLHSSCSVIKLAIIEFMKCPRRYFWTVLSMLSCIFTYLSRLNAQCTQNIKYLVHPYGFWDGPFWAGLIKTPAWGGVNVTSPPTWVEAAQTLGCKSIRLGGWWTVLHVWRQIYNQLPDTLDANHYPPWPWRKGTTLISDTPPRRPLRNFVACFSESPSLIYETHNTGGGEKKMQFLKLHNK